MEKEKQKQHLIDIMRGDEELGLYDEPKQENCCTPIGQIKRYVDCIGCDKKPKQESLTYSEAVKKEERLFNSTMMFKKEILEELAYWKANAEEDYMTTPISVLRYISELENRMYSENDVINALHSVEIKDNKDYSKIYNGMKEWFEQFKKK